MSKRSSMNRGRAGRSSGASQDAPGRGYLRIIAGRFKRQRIAAPPDASVTRPITDRAKTTMFDKLMAMGALTDAPVLDVFAGTGALGLEAISRTACDASFVEQDRRIADLLTSNIEKLGVADRSQVLRVDALSSGWLNMLGPVERRFGLMFVDPPYPLSVDATMRQRLQQPLTALAMRCEPDAIMVLRSPAELDWPAFEGWDHLETRVLGKMAIHYRQCAAGTTPDKAWQ